MIYQYITTGELKLKKLNKSFQCMLNSYTLLVDIKEYNHFVK